MTLLTCSRTWIGAKRKRTWLDGSVRTFQNLQKWIFPVQQKHETAMHMRTMRNTNNLSFNNHAKFVNNCRRPSCEGCELK